MIYLPGRAGRREGAIYDWRELAQKIGDAIMSEIAETGQRYALYGHSFGALLSFLVTVYIREKQGPLPLTLMVGAKNCPTQFAKPAENEKMIHDFSALEMKTYYLENFAHAAPKGFLDMPGMVESIAAVLQIDLGINQKFWWDLLNESEKKPFDFPIHAFHGEKDDRRTEDELLKWEDVTTGPFQFHQYRGNHFFINEDQNLEDFLIDVGDILRDLA